MASMAMAGSVASAALSGGTPKVHEIIGCSRRRLSIPVPATASVCPGCRSTPVFVKCSRPARLLCRITQSRLRWLQGEGRLDDDFATLKGSYDAVGDGPPEIELSSSSSSAKTSGSKGAGRFFESCRFGAAETSGRLSRSILRVCVPRLSSNDSLSNRLRPSNGRTTPGLSFASARVFAVTAPAAAAVALDQVRPSPAEAARTIVDICTEGALSTLSEDKWPTATAVRFALDAGGNPVFRFSSSALHTRNLAVDNRSSLHVQLEQPGRRRPQCTLRGRIQKIDDPTHRMKLDIAWERRFGQERVQEDEYYVMNVEQALYAEDMGEEEVWVSGSDFSAAAADPLRDCAPRIVEDMNRKHWEDVRRFCNSHARLDVEVEEASMTWVDRLGFDLRVLTRSPQTLLEVRIPFVREVSDERDARSSLTMMAQVAWEHERNYSPPDVQLLSSFNVSS